MKNNQFRFFVLILIFLLPLFYNCKTNSSAQRQKQVENQREEKDKQAEKMYNKALAKHLKNQSKDTRNRMKSNKNNSVQSGYSKKKTCFIKRWFSKKDKTCPKS